MPIQKRSCLMLAAAMLAAASAPPLALAEGTVPIAALKDCSEQNVALVYPALLYRKFLPPGFRFPGLGLTAQILVAGAHCASVDGGGPTSSLLTFMEVVPSAAYIDPEIPIYAIALTSYSDSPSTVARFAAAGFGDSIRSGSITVTRVDYPRLHEIRGHVVAGNGDGQVITSTAVFGPVTTIPASRTRLFAVRDGAIVGVADGLYTAHPGYTGLGTLLKSGDGPMVAPIAASIATDEIGFDLTIVPVTLP